MKKTILTLLVATVSISTSFAESGGWFFNFIRSGGRTSVEHHYERSNHYQPQPMYYHQPNYCQPQQMYYQQPRVVIYERSNQWYPQTMPMRPYQQHNRNTRYVNHHCD
jgi:hypothetical protein